MGYKKVIRLLEVWVDLTEKNEIDDIQTLNELRKETMREIEKYNK